MKALDNLRSRFGPDGPFRRRTGDALAAGGGVAILVVCAVIASSGRVGDVERAAFRALNGLPDWLEVPLWVAQLAGVLVVAPLLAALAALARRYRLAAAAVTAAAAKLAVEFLVVKQLVERERPGTTIPDAVLRGVPADGLSFPSGHAVLAFAIAGLLAPYLGRRGQIIVYSIAVLNGFARVYLGAHNPLDVLGGAALGVAIAAAVNLAYGVPTRTAD